MHWLPSHSLEIGTLANLVTCSLVVVRKRPLTGKAPPGSRLTGFCERHERGEGMTRMKRKRKSHPQLRKEVGNSLNHGMHRKYLAN